MLVKKIREILVKDAENFDYFFVPEFVTAGVFFGGGALKLQIRGSTTTERLQHT